ncbi:metal ABC transporter substrate-binding protein [Embleya hyalina]|uniref:ABC transporter substrate-binding protein n=1 Tax=Embleya hyalina TaxID=516124 RepID=A0A401YPU4_9ACTN|nr:metal ABC transporter substrate-binding protein [Embleya hyalina]GCD96619.1 ABC transporter substrate-binding protein [Embleya hyalina]
MRISARAGAALAAGVLSTGALAACGSDDKDAKNGKRTEAAPVANAGAPAAGSGPKVKVVATTTQVADFVRNVGGDRVEVTQLIKANASAHEYEATPADLNAIRGAKLVVENGVDMEKAWLPKAVQAAGFTGKVVDSSTGVRLRKGEPGSDGEESDPHIWHDPTNAKVMVANIGRALSTADATNAKVYENNLAAYTAKLDALDADTRARIDGIPAADRKLVTNHDALGYYVDRYRLEFVGSIIPGFDDQAELSGSRIDEIVGKIKATGAKAVFAESALPPKTAATIAREAGVKVVDGDDSLYADSLGAPGSAGDTYLGAEKHNTDTIVAALRG